ncbi:MAG TPA: TonB-dependent receptor [Thermoanaerobaculia bacterium]|nr:TonB-dependent receptor [Thermoanaerobaculia bacterium]
MRRTPHLLLFLLLLCALAVMPLAAQSTTASIHGTVSDEKGAALANAEVNVVGVASGFVRTTHTAADGSFSINGITPGEINVIVAAPGLDPRTQEMLLLVGQNVDVRFALSPTAVINESITVVGDQPVDTHSSELGTNVTAQQIENLPQNDRNFLNFAALAPGIHLSNDPLRKTFSSDAQPAEQTNVFIDGVSFKNDILQGGIAGQDSSRGNPFPQSAVQEFRVITQNYSAQYDHASSAIITAITKSGGNQFTGNAFFLYQPKNWVADTPSNFQFSSLTTNESYHRNQYGLSLGGPIIKDKANFFFSYEADDEHATTPVNVGNSQFNSRFAQFIGVFGSPFKSKLGFGKASWQPAPSSLFDLSGNYRHEDEVRDFGGTRSFQSANSIKNTVYGSTLRNQWNSANSLNQGTLSFQKYTWSPTPIDSTDVGLNYEGLIRVGGSSTRQKFDQRRIELRDDFTYTGFNWHGSHSLQVGGNFDDMHYNIEKTLFGNPEYLFRQSGGGFDFPVEAQFGFGNPNLSISNKEFGLYGQDNWTFNNKLILNLGLRWDYETKQLDDSYVTPANIVAGLTGKVPSDYFSSGNDRSPYKKEIQPRLGFSYDIAGNNRTVIFGGAGRYYDRLFLNATLDERFRLQYPVYRINFSADGANGTVKWDPKYLTAAGLSALIAQGSTRPEIYLLNNNTKPPYSNQFNLGVRQALFGWQTSLSYSAVRGYRGFTWLSATGLCCSALVPGFGNVIISDPKGKQYWYNGIYLSVDRPFRGGQLPWGAHFAWTHGKAEQNGNDLFSLDYPSAATYPRHIVPGTERDRIVATGTVGLPYGTRLSTILSFGSGGATNVLDFSQGFSLQNRLVTHPFKNSIYPKKTWGFADRSIDLRLEKEVSVRTASVALVGEGFNIGNFHNFGCLNNFIPPEGNPTLGQANCVVNLGRRYQAGVKVKF